MEKLTQPYLRLSLGVIEESEPWLMSGWKLSPACQQTTGCCCGAVPSLGAHPSERSWVMNMALGLVYECIELPHSSASAADGFQMVQAPWSATTLLSWRTAASLPQKPRSSPSACGYSCQRYSGHPFPSCSK